jgi:hypothetical protein
MIDVSKSIFLPYQLKKSSAFELIQRKLNCFEFNKSLLLTNNKQKIQLIPFLKLIPIQ